MSSPAEKVPSLPGDDLAHVADSLAARRADVDAKQMRVAAFLQEVGCEGLLVLEPENFAWLSSGASARGILDPADMPGLFFMPEQRWLLAANVDSQRLFDEELDGLGFQLKEWPWNWGRQQFLADLCQGRIIACDRTLADCTTVGDKLRRLRRTLTDHERSCLRALGQIVGHALEATCRTMVPKLTEREIAGQVGHRLLHRGAQPIALGVAADDRARAYRRHNFTETPVEQHAVLTATASKYGLYATASRSVYLGSPPAELRQEYDAACKVSASYAVASVPNAVPRDVLQATRRIFEISGFEHEWRTAPQGHLTGRAAVELPFTPTTEELLPAGSAVTWHVTIGAASSCDTFLIGDGGAELVTPMESWSVKRIRIHGEEFFRPYLLVR